MSKRLDRLQDLQRTMKEYLKAERKRAENEVSVLEAILSGRTGGAGIQQVSIATIAAVANKDLTAYLEE